MRLLDFLKKEDDIKVYNKSDDLVWQGVIQTNEGEDGDIVYYTLNHVEIGYLVLKDDVIVKRCVYLKKREESMMREIVEVPIQQEY